MDNVRGIKTNYSSIIFINEPIYMQFLRPLFDKPVEL
jgi:hypothetical protein